MADEAERPSAPLLPGGYEAPPQYSSITKPPQAQAYDPHPPPEGHTYPPHPPPDGSAYPPGVTFYPPQPPPGYTEDPGHAANRQAGMAPGYAPLGPTAAPCPNAVPGQTAGSVQVTTSVVLAPSYGGIPVLVYCPHCHQHVTTRLEFVSGTLTILIALLMCFFGLIWGCCLIPFCVDGCKDVVHSCPVCGNALGTFRRM